MATADVRIGMPVAPAMPRINPEPAAYDPNARPGQPGFPGIPLAYGGSSPTGYQNILTPGPGGVYDPTQNQISYGASGPQFKTFTAFDQYPSIGIAASRDTSPYGGIQTGIRGTPVSQYGRPVGSQVQFEDVLAPTFYNPEASRPFTGQEFLERGLSSIAPSQDGIDPVTQRILNLIDERTKLSRERASSEAQALASRRGLAGSSIEQFGVQEGVAGANRLGEEQVQGVLQNEIQNQLALRQLQAQGLFGYAGGEQTAGSQYGLGNLDAQLRNRMLASQLTSDELASNRYTTQANMDRALQERLGAAGIAQAYQGLSVAQSEAEKDRRSNRTNAIIGGVGGVIGGLL